MNFFKSFNLTEEDFINEFIDAVFAQDQHEMSKLCDLAFQTFGTYQASALVSNCCQSITSADPNTGTWLKSWLKKYREQ